MIPKTVANKILDWRFGVSKNTLTPPSAIYLGLCADEPNHENGNLANCREPIRDAEGQDTGYARERVGGAGTKNTVDGNTTWSGDTFINKYFSTAAGGVISNSVDEIKMKTALRAYPEKINYWFLTESGTAGGGDAFIWGEVKDVMYEKTQLSFSGTEAPGVVESKVTLESSLLLMPGQEYIVYWANIVDGKEDSPIEYHVKCENAGNLGYKLTQADGYDKPPFEIWYKMTIDADDSNKAVYTLTVQYGSSTTDDKIVGIYSKGITVNKATVPTFYKGELKASIDVPLVQVAK